MSSAPDTAPVGEKEIAANVCNVNGAIGSSGASLTSAKWVERDALLESYHELLKGYY